MSSPSPLQPWLEEQGALDMAFGEDVRLAGQIWAFEIEYAALRKGAGLLDCPHRGLIRLEGRDRLDFLNRFLTQDCRSMAPGEVRRGFLLSAKGRIEADLLVIETGQATWLDLDRHTAGPVAAQLENLLFGEDVRIGNLSDSHHRLSFFGPQGAAALTDWKARDPAAGSGLDYLYPIVSDRDSHCWVPAEAAAGVTAHLEEWGKTHRLKPVGWMAWNTARIENGHPLFCVDFGTGNLPHETSLVPRTVSFTKGCYRGQEIVARMQNLGHPAKCLTAFRAIGPEVPVAGVPLAIEPGSQSETVGAVTSSTFSPMLSGAAIGLGLVKWGRHTPGTRLFAPAEGKWIEVEIQPQLDFLQRGVNPPAGQPPSETRGT